MNEELIQQYLRIHFKAISKQLKNGPGYRFSGQDRAYFKKLVAVDAHGTRRSTNPPSWEEVHIEPKQLYAVINEFFQLCFRAEQINPTYQEIGKWMHSLVCLCCYRWTNEVVSSYAVWQLFAMADQVTAFLFKNIDWGKDTGDQLDGFDSRIRFLKEYDTSTGEMRNCYSLLYPMKTQRNYRSHTAYNFYTDRQATMQQLIYLLYDYINLYYYIRVILSKELNGQAKRLISGLGSLTSLDIRITCVDTQGNPLTDSAYTIELYQQGGSRLSPKEAKGNNVHFQVERYATYFIRVSSDKQAAQDTNPFSIDESYANPSEVKVIPPKDAKPPQPVIYDIVRTDLNNLPVELDTLLKNISQLAAQEPQTYQGYMDIAQAFLTAAITNSEQDKLNLKTTLKRINQEMEGKKQKELPAQFLDFLHGKAKEVQKALAKPYQTIDFRRLCVYIEDYHKQYAALFNAKHDEQMPLMEQHLANVRDFLFKGRTATGTTAVQRSLDIEQRLSFLLTIIHLSFHYPDVVKAEIGDRDLLLNEIVKIYNDATSFYTNKVGMFWWACYEVNEFVNKHKKDDPENKLSPATSLLRGIVMDSSSEELLIYMVKGRTLLQYLLDYIQETNLVPQEMIEACRHELDSVQNQHYEDEFREVSLSEGEVQDVEGKINALRTYLKQLEENRTKFLADIDKLREKVIRPKGFLNHLFNFHCYAVNGELQTNYDEKVRYEALQRMLTLPAKDILNFMLFASGIEVFNHQILQGLSGGLGFFSTYITAEDVWNKYASENKGIFEKMSDIGRELRKKYQNKTRVRRLANCYESDMDILRTEARMILQAQIEYLQSTYKNKQGKTEIPEYLQTFIDIPQESVPDYMKIDVLQTVICQLQKGIYRYYILYMTFIEQLWKDSSQVGMSNDWKHLYDFFTGKWARDMYTMEIIQNDFPNSTKKEKARYIKYLMQGFHIGDLCTARCFLIAFNLNFGWKKLEQITQTDLENGIIPRRELILKMAMFTPKTIIRAYLDPEYNKSKEENQRYENRLVEYIAAYCRLFPEEEDIWELHQQQLAAQEEIKRKEEESKETKKMIESIEKNKNKTQKTEK